MLKITYLGHSCFLLNDGTHEVIIDPFITHNPKATVKASDIKAKFVVLTHAHGDHSGDAFTIAKANGATLIAVNELANYAQENGIEAHNMHIGGAWNFPFGRLKFTIAHHGSANQEGRYMGAPAGVVIRMGGKTIYHTGDTGLFMDMQLIGQLDRIDVMMCPIGGNFTMDAADAARAVAFVQPELAIPMHFNTFPVIEADPAEFTRLVASKGHKAQAMEVGETIIFE